MKTRKLTALFATAAMAVTAAAGTVTVSAEEKPHIVIGSYVDPANNEDPGNAKWVEFYQKISEETGVEIEVQTIPWDQIESKLVVTNMTGSPSADMYLMSSQKIASVVNAGAALCLDEFVDRDLNRDDYVEAALAAGSVNGKLYCIPSGLHSRGLWYNTELIPEAPKTMDELVEYAKAATDAENNVYGFAFNAVTSSTIENALAGTVWDNGGAYCDAEGKATWASPEVAEAIQFYNDCVNEYGITPESCKTSTNTQDFRDMFADGRLGCFIDGSFAGGFLADSQRFKDGKLQFCPFPGKEGPAPNFANGWSFAIASNSKNADACWEVVKAIMSVENQTEHAVFDSCLPITKASYEDEAFSTPLYQAMAANMEKARGMDPLVNYSEALDAIANVNASYMLDPTQDLNALLQESQDQFNAKFFD